MLNLWVSAVSAHLDPAWWAERHLMIGLRRWAPVFAAAAGVLLVFAVGLGYLAWQDWKGNMGPPPLSQGTFGVAFSPDRRTVAAWCVGDGNRQGDLSRAPHGRADGRDDPDHHHRGNDPQDRVGLFFHADGTIACSQLPLAGQRNMVTASDFYPRFRPQRSSIRAGW